LNEGEKILRMGPVIKRRRLMNTKKRQLILTNTPRVVYADPLNMEIKGRISFSSISSAVLKDRTHFIIKTKEGRDYWFEDKSKEAQQWVKAINDLKKDN